MGHFRNSGLSVSYISTASGARELIFISTARGALELIISESLKQAESGFSDPIDIQSNYTAQDFILLAVDRQLKGSNITEPIGSILLFIPPNTCAINLSSVGDSSILNLYRQILIRRNRAERTAELIELEIFKREITERIYTESVYESYHMTHMI